MKDCPSENDFGYEVNCTRMACKPGTADPCTVNPAVSFTVTFIVAIIL